MQCSLATNIRTAPNGNTLANAILPGMEPVALENLIQSMDTLYGQLPQVHCRACGECCVLPTTTLTEFVYLVRKGREELGSGRFDDAVLTPPRLSTVYDGNCECVFLVDGNCSLHPARTGACRLFGIPSLGQLGVADLVECAYAVPVSGNADPAFVTDWLNRLMDLNRGLYPLDQHPFVLTGLNLAGWFDLYFDTTLDIPYFKHVREILHGLIDLSHLAQRYRPATGLRDKIDKINVFIELIDLGDAALLKQLLISIRDDYPLTGSWWHGEAQTYLKAIDSRDAGEPGQE